MSDDPCRAILRALAGLVLVEVGPMASEAIFLALGPGGTRSLINEDADVEVSRVDGGPLIRYRRERSGSFREGDQYAAIEAIGALVGQTVSSVEHGHRHRLTLRFAGGGVVRLRRCAHGAGMALDDDLEWSVLDDASCRGVDARRDGSLVASSWWEREDLEPPATVWGRLGVLRAPAYRPRPASAVPRAVAPGGWSALLGGLVGQRVAAVKPGRPDGRLRIAFDAKAALFADSCNVTVDDGAARTLFHRTSSGDLSDPDAAMDALRALAGRTVEGVEHGDRNRLAVALSDGGEIIFERAWSDLVDWQIIRRIDDLKLRSLRVLSPQARLGDDDGTLVLSSVGDGRPATFGGGLGRVTAADVDLSAAVSGSQLRRARALLAAPVGLALTEANRRRLEFGEPQPWRDGTWTAPPVRIQLGWANQQVRAPGKRGNGRLVTAEDHEEVLAPVLGVRLAELTHEAPGRLVLTFEDGHRITLDPTVTPIPEWSVGLSRTGPWAAAMGDDSLRTMGPEDHIRDAGRYVYGSLGAAPGG